MLEVSTNSHIRGTRSRRIIPLASNQIIKPRSTMASKAQSFQRACRLQSRSCTSGQLRRTTDLQRLQSTNTSARSIASTTVRRTVPATQAHTGRLLPISQRNSRHQTQLRNASTGSSSSPPPQGPTRRAITVTSDDGRYSWSELSRGEKAARSTQQTFNFLLVSAGAVLTVS